MQKSKKAGVTRAAFLPQAEQELLSHVELCFSVALALTRDPALGRRLARETLLWAWRRQAERGSLGGGDVKMVLLRELRSRFLHHYYPVCAEDHRSTGMFASTGGKTRSGTAPKPRKKAVCAAAADHVQTGRGE